MGGALPHGSPPGLPLDPSAAWRVQPGRRLRRSPPWHGEADHLIVFDASSGDYWMLGPAADAQLRAIEHPASGAGRPEVAADAGMLAELQRCGLIVPVA